MKMIFTAILVKFHDSNGKNVILKTKKLAHFLLFSAIHMINQFTKVNGSTAKNVDVVFVLLNVEDDMMACGTMICTMDMVD